MITEKQKGKLKKILEQISTPEEMKDFDLDEFDNQLEGGILI